jgi:putative membrane protein
MLNNRNHFSVQGARSTAVFALKDHQAEVRDFSAEAQSGTDANVKTFASNVLPTLQQHLDQVKGLNKSEKNK